MKKWEEVFPEADRALLQKTAMAGKQTFGNNPALIIVDVNNAFVGSRPQPIMESVEEYKTSCGDAGWAALADIRRLLCACRDRKVPVIYTTNDPITIQFSWGPTKNSGNQEIDLEGNEIAAMIEPLPTEWVLRKTKASAFFGTALASALNNLKVDCLLIAGATTSGCVRATVVDAFSYRYPCFIVEECVFDRFQLSHLVNLFDMNAKYADVITLQEALGLLDKLAR